MDFIASHQLDIMLFLCGMCAILTVMTAVTKALPYRTKFILASMEFSAALLLLFERFAYIYRGDVSETGYYMVRISNGMVFFLSLLLPLLVTKYLEVLFINEAGFKSLPRQLQFTQVLFVAGALLLIVSQFTGLYYTFDDLNNYQRARWHMLCYVPPFLIVLLQEWTILRYRKQLNCKLVRSTALCIALPTIASVSQIFLYSGYRVSLASLTMAFIVCVFYTYTLRFLSETAEQARARELEFYKEAKRKESELLAHTAQALDGAIDAKDRYTSGHSARVALISRKIAEEAGLSAVDCEQVYFAALLHDIGKIGVSHEIINKTEKLTDEEFRQIRSHAELGSRILSRIREAPYLSEGARHHHERYDGKGYPDGLSGEEIPELARIIAVADSYDAMTSTRSYRHSLSGNVVRGEIEAGSGTQFDPRFALIMLRLIDEGWPETVETDREEVSIDL